VPVLLGGNGRKTVGGPDARQTLRVDGAPERPGTKTDERRWIYELGYATLVLGATVLALSPVLRRSGWPLVQGTTAPLLLVQMYAAHIRHLDLFPVWSSTDGFGMGTPVLLGYHRTFFYVAGVFSALGLGLKASVVTTIAIFMIVGAYGMRRVLAFVTTSRLLCVVGSLGFLFTNYVFTDWLDPRGDLAEFSALMIVPWLLYWCLRLVKLKQFSYLIIPIMVLLVNTHSAIALTSLFLLAIAFAVYFAFSGTQGLRSIAVRLVVSVSGVAVLLAPILLAELRFSKFYDPQSKNILGYNAEHQFLDIGRYLFDGKHQWFSHNQTPPWFNFVQIDFAIWIPIAAALAFLAIRWSARRFGLVGSGRRARPKDSAVVFLVASLAFYVFLQLRASYVIYRVLTPLQVINFPWRMLAYITPLGVVVVVVIADRAMRRIPSTPLWGTLAVLWFASLVLLSPILTENGYRVTPARLSPIKLFMAPKYVDYETFEGFFNTYGFPPGPLYDPFLTKVVSPNGREVEYLTPLYRQLHSHQAGAQSLSSIPCTVQAPPHAAFETLELTFTVYCQGRTRLALPISYNPSSTILVKSASGELHQISYSHLPSDPRIIIEVAGGRKETVVVHLPTLWGILSH
jgi:hypothetical protein